MSFWFSFRYSFPSTPQKAFSVLAIIAGATPHLTAIGMAFGSSSARSLSASNLACSRALQHQKWSGESSYSPHSVQSLSSIWPAQSAFVLLHVDPVLVMSKIILSSSFMFLVFACVANLSICFKPTVSFLQPYSFLVRFRVHISLIMGATCWKGAFVI